MKQMYTAMIALSILGIMAGCASDKEFKRKAEVPTTRISVAEQSGAVQVPTAAYYLELSKKEVEEAKTLSSKGKQKQATSLLQRAQADAELAIALSREDAEKKEAAETMGRVKQLESETKTEEEGKTDDETKPEDETKTEEPAEGSTP